MNLLTRKPVSVALDEENQYTFSVYLAQGSDYFTREVTITDTGVDLNWLMKLIAEGETSVTDSDARKGDLFVQIDGHKTLIGSWYDRERNTPPAMVLHFLVGEEESEEVDGDEVEDYDFSFAAPDPDEED